MQPSVYDKNSNSDDIPWIGTIRAIQPTLLCEVDSYRKFLECVSTIEIGACDIGKNVFLIKPANSKKHVILGLLKKPLSSCRESKMPQTLELSATQNIVIRCGESSVSLNGAGKIEINGVSLKMNAGKETEIKSAKISLN